MMQTKINMGKCILKLIINEKTNHPLRMIGSNIIRAAYCVLRDGMKGNNHIKVQGATLVIQDIPYRQIC